MYWHSHCRAQPKICTVICERHLQHWGTAQPAQLRGPWPFYCALAVWGSLLKEPCNFWTAGTGERRIKAYRGTAVTQSFVLTPETWVVLPNFSPSCQQQERQSYHRALNTSPLLSLVMSEEPWSQGSPRVGKVNVANALKKLEGGLATQTSYFKGSLVMSAQFPVKCVVYRAFQVCPFSSAKARLQRIVCYIIIQLQCVDPFWHWNSIK